MESAKQLADRFREVLLSGRWIANTNYREQLSSLGWKQATEEIRSLNTIAALTYHINYYLAGINNVFEGGGLEIRDRYSFDLPPITSQEDWETLHNTLFRNAESFAGHVERLTDADLEAPFVYEKYGNYRRNIEGVIEHSYYHLGQIVLIGRMVA